MASSTATLPKQLTTAPPQVANVIISFPAEHVVLVMLNRPKQLNAIPKPQHAVLAGLWRWYDDEPWLRCAVLTGSGRAFCAGADLREWDDTHKPQSQQSQPQPAGSNTTIVNVGGFGGMANRGGKKPIVLAVNGLALGGGMEMVINADIVVAAASARFGLPEVSRGVIAVAGALPRLVRVVGRQRAAEMALLGRTSYTAEQMREWGLVNFVVPAEGDVVDEALRVAKEMAANSPDAVIVSREGLRLGWEGMGPEAATEILAGGLYGRIDGGENMLEGVRSFVEKRKPVWRDSKL
ncbi:carnitinyl-CoA dehydratase [Magnaporthiopsis poae ATCC 64411]|uniref:Carnitinyl-CoA dehydratase n=1 Tax=Magnaporthiopsis poae (strain ATCC 64411 / 73-15) TaxID=644358 RepID=A0A0C4EFB6_MAGP6|nr:carnitinyl-CoA dehydratase [Magnaporthiopsis poae ATCC 64411]